MYERHDLNPLEIIARGVRPPAGWTSYRHPSSILFNRKGARFPVVKVSCRSPGQLRIEVDTMNKGKISSAVLNCQSSTHAKEHIRGLFASLSESLYACQATNQQ